METAPDSLTHMARSLRQPPSQPAPPIEVPSPPSPAPQAPPPAPSSSTSSADLQADDYSVTSQDIQPLRRRFSRSPAPSPSPPPLPKQAPKPSFLARWLPLLVAWVTFLGIFSAGPLVVQTRFTKADGRPDKAQWAMVAGIGAALAMLIVYAARRFL